MIIPAANSGTDPTIDMTEWRRLVKAGRTFTRGPVAVYPCHSNAPAAGPCFAADSPSRPPLLSSKLSPLPHGKSEWWQLRVSRYTETHSSVVHAVRCTGYFPRESALPDEPATGGGIRPSELAVRARLQCKAVVRPIQNDHLNGQMIR